MTKAEVKEILGSADSNKDGKLDYIEVGEVLVDYIQVFYY
jgi:hypothetical protein